MTRLGTTTLAVLFLFFSTSLAAGPARAEEEPRSKEERLADLDREVARAFAEKDYAKAEAKCREQVALDSLAEGPVYNLACALARQGRSADAVAALRRAYVLGFADADHIAEDEDLASIRGEKGFAEVLSEARAEQEKALEKLHEPACDVAGTRTVEGKPEKGLRWRLRLGNAATAKSPHRLVVWLHPSGGSMNAKVEPMATDLATKGWALLVVTAKRWESWTERDVKRLLEGTLPDVAKVEGLDAKRPVLMGFSAGGQAALLLWSRDAARWGGLVLDAAYPLRPADDGTDRFDELSPPAGEERKGCPIFVVVGDADEGHALWKDAEKPWRDAGVPLRVTYVAGGEHAWLFGKAEVESLLAWLGDVAAGKRPSAGAAPSGK